MATFVFNPSDPPTMTAEQYARLDAMTDEEIEAAALSDPDNPPSTEAELASARLGNPAGAARAHLGMSQEAFAAAFRIDLSVLRAREALIVQPEDTLQAYLTVIAREPEAVRRALAGITRALAAE